MDDWKFWVGDVIVPIITFVIGLFVGKTIEHKSTTKIRGNNNKVIQNSKVSKRR